MWSSSIRKNGTSAEAAAAAESSGYLARPAAKKPSSESFKTEAKPNTGGASPTVFPGLGAAGGPPPRRKPTRTPLNSGRACINTTHNV